MPAETSSDAALLVQERPPVYPDRANTTESEWRGDDDVAAADGEADSCRDTASADTSQSTRVTWIRRVRWKRVLTYGVLPGLAVALAVLAAYLKWMTASAHDAQLAGIDSVRAASDSTIAMLSYKPDTVEKDLTAAGDRLTGQFKDSYATLIRDVVIPGAKQQKVSSVASVAAAAPVTTTENHAIVLLFVNQAITIGSDPPTSTASSVRVTLDKVGDRWLISQFDPV